MTALVTDSTSDLPPAQAAQLGVQVIPLSVQMEGRELLDWLEIDPDAVYSHLQAGGTARSQPVPVERFEAEYTRLLQTHEQILSVHISRKLSDTVKNAQEARKRLPDPERVVVLDSGLAAAPLAEVVLAAKAVLDAGGDITAAEKAISDTRAAMLAEFSVASLEYLRRSGRIGRVAEVMGNLLNVRPVLRFSAGEFVVNRRSRAPQVLDEMLANLTQQFGKEPVNVALAHAGRDTARVHAIRNAIRQSGLNVKSGRAYLLGPVIGSHVGPGTFGVMAYPVQER